MGGEWRSGTSPGLETIQRGHRVRLSGGPALSGNPGYEVMGFRCAPEAAIPKRGGHRSLRLDRQIAQGRGRILRFGAVYNTRSSAQYTAREKLCLREARTD